MSRPERRFGKLPTRAHHVQGSIHARRRGQPALHVDHVMSRFKLTRAHASMVLGKLANGPYAIQRPSRGVYAHSSVG